MLRLPLVSNLDPLAIWAKTQLHLLKKQLHSGLMLLQSKLPKI